MDIPDSGVVIMVERELDSSGPTGSRGSMAIVVTVRFRVNKIEIGGCLALAAVSLSVNSLIRVMVDNSARSLDVER